MKYFLYARKSTDDNGHQLLSIDAQLTELRKFAKQRHLRVVAISRVAISDEWHAAMHEQIDLWREEALDESRATLDRLRKELAESDEKLERLLDLLVDGTLTRDEYTLRKEKYVTAKANLKDRIAQSEAKGADKARTFGNVRKPLQTGEKSGVLRESGRVEGIPSIDRLEPCSDRPD